jgi:hypothetical protein
VIDFSGYEIDTLSKYEGSDQKRGIIYNGNRYMLKLSDKLSTFHRNSLNSSYSNSVYSEYVCCHILNELGFEAQETLIGVIVQKTKSGEIKEVPVVACKNFIPDGYELVEFKKIESALLIDHKPPKIPALDDIYEILMSDNVYFTKEKGAEFLKRYWDVFVLDALLGNFDRHADNWGYLINRQTKEIELSPIYDCGSCLYPQLADDQLERIMNSPEEIDNRIFKFPTACLSVDDKKVSYYEYMCGGGNADLEAAILRIVPKIDMKIIAHVIDSVDEITSVRKTFYKFMLQERYDKILKPAWKQTLEMDSVRRKRGR